MDAILDPIIHATTTVLADYGVWAVLVLMLIESMCIPAPSEVIMLYAGYLVYQHNATLLEVVAAGVIGNILGSWVAWAAGAYGGRQFMEKHGKWVHLSEKHLAWADNWFEKRGPATVFFTRMMPIIRTFISLPAGIARMPFWRFTVYTSVGCVPWVLMLALIGKRLGPHWEDAHHVLHYLDYVAIAGVIALVAYVVIRYYRNQRAAT